VHIDNTLREELCLWITAFLAWLSWWSRDILAEALWVNVRKSDELFCYLQQAVIRPITEPVDDATIEEGW